MGVMPSSTTTIVSTVVIAAIIGGGTLIGTRAVEAMDRTNTNALNIERIIHSQEMNLQALEMELQLHEARKHDVDTSTNTELGNDQPIRPQGGHEIVGEFVGEFQD
jgi:hypothetical protein